MYLNWDFWFENMPSGNPVSQEKKERKKNVFACPGDVVIESASRNEDSGFESGQGVKLLGLCTLQCCGKNK
jgi:hypothetical protein